MSEQEQHQIIEVRIPNSMKVPQGTQAVWAKPKKGWSYLCYSGEIEVAGCDRTNFAVCFVPKFTWPEQLPGVAISRNRDGYVLHFDYPVRGGNGIWLSESNKIIHRECYPEGWIPELEIGECVFKSEVDKCKNT